ncbi:hypothetical protein [Clostridium cellulovorans]|uniref:hypothetical protein n=1 Tax=Clostridium cellulovorans TaxID=1493 RepID=UPI0001E8EEB9|nr:hypothetical protein [Clostridium cellulovorans]
MKKLLGVADKSNSYLQEVAIKGSTNIEFVTTFLLVKMLPVSLLLGNAWLGQLKNIFIKLYFF